MSNDQKIPDPSQDQASLSATTHGPPAEKDEQPLVLTRHSVYYFDPVVFRVEGVLFKVPKYGFMVPGTMFYDMFSLPVPDGEEAQGSSDTNPIELPSGITHQEFFGFLFLLYPFLGHEANFEIHYEELVGALKLGTMWEMTNVRIMAIRLLSPMLDRRNPVENVLLAKKYRLKRVLREGYSTLIDRYNTIQSLREPHQLDWETISGIFAARAHSLEFILSEIATDLGISQDMTPLEEYIDIVFGEEFKYMEDETEIDFQGLDKVLQDRLTTSKSNKKVTSEGSRLSPQSFQEEQVSTTTEINRRHHVYYIDMISVRVGSTLFSLPKSEILALHEDAGLTDKENPDDSIRDLGPEITEDYFCRFLMVLYPIDNVPLDYTYEKWLGVLYLSTLWGKEKIRQRAIVELTPLMTEKNRLERVLIARRYHVKHWLFRALEQLVVQSPPRMIQSLRERPYELDWETIAKLLSIRDQSIKYSPDAQRPNVRCVKCRRAKSKGENMSKGECSYSCRNIHLPLPVHDFCLALDREINAQEDLEADQNVIGRQWEKVFEHVDSNVARGLIEKEFAEETMYW